MAGIFFIPLHDVQPLRSPVPSLLVTCLLMGLGFGSLVDGSPPTDHLDDDQALAVVELSQSVGGLTPRGDTVITGYSANYTANQNVYVVERDVLMPVETLERDENFLPLSQDSQYFAAWLESDETKWEPHSHLYSDAHAIMWLKATEQGPIGPEPSAILRAGQQYGFIASHGSMAMQAPPYLPNGSRDGVGFLELAGPVVTQTQGYSNTGASDLTGVVMAGFAGFLGGDYHFDEQGAVTLTQNFTLPEIAARAGDNYAYTWAWIRPQDTEVGVDFDLDLPAAAGSVTVTIEGGFFKQARELPMPGGFIQRYWGVVFSLYLYFFPPHQGQAEAGESSQGMDEASDLRPHSRMLWALEPDTLGEMRTRWSGGQHSWSNIQGGMGLELEGSKVLRVHAPTEAPNEADEPPDTVGNEQPFTAQEEDNEANNAKHVTGAGQVSYELDTDYLGQGFVAITNLTPWSMNHSLVDAYGLSYLQLEGTDIALTSDMLVDHSALPGVWVFGMSIGWITLSPTLQNGGNPSFKSDSWWWIFWSAGSTVQLVYKINNEVLVLAKLMTYPRGDFSDTVIHAGAYTLDSQQKQMKLFQHLDPALQGNVNYASSQEDQEFGPRPVGTGGVSEHMEVTGNGMSVRWTPQDEGAGFCVVDSGELVAHPDDEVNGETITDQDVRFYIEVRNFGEEYYRAYAIYGNTQFRMNWGGDQPVYDLQLELQNKPDEADIGSPLKLAPTITNWGLTPIQGYLLLTVDNHEAWTGFVNLTAGEQQTLPISWVVGTSGATGTPGMGPWENFTLLGRHSIHLEVFPLGAEENSPEDNVVQFDITFIEAGDSGFGSVTWFLLLMLILIILGAALYYHHQQQEEAGMNSGLDGVVDEAVSDEPLEAEMVDR